MHRLFVAGKILRKGFIFFHVLLPFLWWFSKVFNQANVIKLGHRKVIFNFLLKRSHLWFWASGFLQCNGAKSLMKSHLKLVLIFGKSFQFTKIQIWFQFYKISWEMEVFLEKIRWNFNNNYAPLCLVGPLFCKKKLFQYIPSGRCMYTYGQTTHNHLRTNVNIRLENFKVDM